jgi:hypothetical protein
MYPQYFSLDKLLLQVKWKKELKTFLIKQLTDNILLTQFDQHLTNRQTKDSETVLILISHCFRMDYK